MYTEPFKLAVRFLSENFILRNLHAGMVAQWILESDRGNSKLAREHNNFAGIKYRKELEGIAAPKSIQVPSEPAPVDFAYFKSPQDFVRGVFKFLDRSPYDGWREQPTAEAYVRHVGRVWATDPDYVQKVINLIPEAAALISSVAVKPEVLDPTWFEMFKTSSAGAVIVGYNGGKPLWYTNIDRLSDVVKLTTLFGDHNLEVAPKDKRVPTANSKSFVDLQKLYADTGDKKQPGTGEKVKKPLVEWVRSPNFSARGSGIKRIVLHYTTSSNINGTISWFQNPASRVSAHYIVGRDGKIVQMVRDSDKAWHAAGHNDDTIGIENVASTTQSLTGPQSDALAHLCKWLMAEYKILKDNVTGHRFLPNNTDCPGPLFGERTQGALRTWVDTNLS